MALVLKTSWGEILSEVRILHPPPITFLKILGYINTMTKNPFINALSALLYIIAVASSMYYGSRIASGPDTVFAPIAMISLLTFSVATMGFLFFYQPFQLYFAGEKKNALNLFLKTLVIFGCFTAFIFSLILARVFSGF